MAGKKTPAAPAPRLNKDGSVTLTLQVVRCNPDGVQYKPYSSELVPVSPVFIEVIVEQKHILSFIDNNLILSPRGWYAVAKLLATASVLAAGG